MKKFILSILIFSTVLYGGNVQVVTPQTVANVTPSSSQLAQITINIPVDIDEPPKWLMGKYPSMDFTATSRQKIRCQVITSGAGAQSTAYYQEKILHKGKYTVSLKFNDITELEFTELHSYRCWFTYEATDGKWHSPTDFKEKYFKTISNTFIDTPFSN